VIATKARFRVIGAASPGGSIITLLGSGCLAATATMFTKLLIGQHSPRTASLLYRTKVRAMPDGPRSRRSGRAATRLAGFATSIAIAKGDIA
jgi:hypothetical protein